MAAGVRVPEPQVLVCLWALLTRWVVAGPHPWQMEVPRLGVEMELQLPDDTTTTATQQHQI